MSGLGCESNCIWWKPLRYSLDGDEVPTYNVEINTEDGTIFQGQESDATLDQPSCNQRLQLVPAPRFAYSESLKQDVLEQLSFVKYQEESFEDEVKATEYRDVHHQSLSNDNLLVSPSSVHATFGQHALLSSPQQPGVHDATMTTPMAVPTVSTGSVLCDDGPSSLAAVLGSNTFNDKYNIERGVDSVDEDDTSIGATLQKHYPSPRHGKDDEDNARMPYLTETPKGLFFPSDEEDNNNNDDDSADARAKTPRTSFVFPKPFLGCGASLGSCLDADDC